MEGNLILFDTSYVDSFRRYLTSERQAPANTVSSYMRDINQFVDYLVSCGKYDFTRVSDDDVRGFIFRLEENGRAPATISRCISSIRALYFRMSAEGFVGANPAAGISSFNAEKKPPSVLTEAEIVRLLEQPDAREPKGCRDKAMLEILYATGIRASELIALNEGDVNLITGLVTCRNGKDRTIPIYDAAVKAVSRYLSFARQIMAQPREEALFVNTGGGRLTRQGFWKILKGYKDSAGITEEITPQAMRNSFAAHLLENGADLHSLQEMMGHADISSTQVFARSVRKNLKDVYNRAHPRAV